ATNPYTAPVRSPFRTAGTRMTGDSMRRPKGNGGIAAVLWRSGARHREYWLRRGERLREDHLDVVAEHLGVDRCGALVLAVDELGWPVGHHVARERGVFQRRDDLSTLRAAGAFQRVGDEQDARVVHEHLISVELPPVLDLLLERQGFRIARVEPVIAVHDVLRGFRELLNELVGGRSTTEDRIDALLPHALLLHGAG